MGADRGFTEAASQAYRRILLWILATLGLGAVAAGIVWATMCPCGTLPGFALRGDVRETPVTDWGFVNDVPLCQIQITIGWRPHSVNVNCMATPSGELFLSCSFGVRKHWCPRVGDNQPGRLRLEGIVYSVVLNRVTDPATLDRAWAARVQKLQDPRVLAVQPFDVGPAPDAERPESWWSFSVVSSRG